jgi:multiple sugar transport system permease protein
MAGSRRADEDAGGMPVSSSPAYKLVLYLLLFLFGIFFALPIVWMAITSIKPPNEWLTPNFIPRSPTLNNLTSIFNDPTLPVARWFFNSFIIATIFTTLIVIIDSLAAYAYARMEFRGRKLLFALLLTTLVMPGIMFLIPNYITIAQLGWLGTYQGIIAPGLSGVFGVFFLRQFFLSIPRELEEAAYVDGANTWQTFFRVVLPLSGGAIATLAVITFLTSWNDFLWPLLMTFPVREMQTLPVGLATLQGQYTFDYGKLMAGALVLTLPVLLLYVLSQRFIIRSIATTGLKG